LAPGRESAGELDLAEVRQPAVAPSGQHRSLRADCGRCAGLCCVAPAFTASADFAISKEAGQPCPNLRPDFRCSVHDRLRPLGFPGCAAYDCFGAGQQVTQVTFGGQDWQRNPAIAPQMFGAFTIMRQLHELLWYLSEALTLAQASPVHGELRRALAATGQLTGRRAAALAELDVPALRREINALLLRASELARAGASDSPADFRGADLTGKDLRGASLRGASLRGACLIGADLSGAELILTDFTGADLRGTDLSGADLAASIFLTQSQVDVARGDAATRLPPSLARPPHWRPA
jgi:uncharacterized protein YjbI with pentapeptide repeats